MLTFTDFRKRARERGLPFTKKMWINYEAQGLVEFRKLPSGRRIFASVEEIEGLLDKFEGKNGN